MQKNDLKWDKVLKSGLSKFCGRQPLKNLLSTFLNTLPQICLRVFVNIQRFEAPSQMFDRVLNTPLL